MTYSDVIKKHVYFKARKGVRRHFISNGLAARYGLSRVLGMGRYFAVARAGGTVQDEKPGHRRL
jgi:hypothetical protein